MCAKNWFADLLYDLLLSNGFEGQMLFISRTEFIFADCLNVSDLMDTKIDLHKNSTWHVRSAITFLCHFQ